MRFLRLFEANKPLVGVIHLAALPGIDGSPGIDAVIRRASEDYLGLARGGIDAVLVENENDKPYSVRARPETIAAMTHLMRELARLDPRVPIGGEILLNDPVASLAATSLGGGAFIRTDYFVDRMSRPEYGGEMHIDPDGLIDYRTQLGAQDVAVVADIQVKHAKSLTTRSLAESASEAKAKGADAIVVTGSWTGIAPEANEVSLAKSGAGETPVLIGSGLTADNAVSLLSVADGAIVGTSLMDRGRVVPERVGTLVARVRRINELSKPGESHGN